jgi:C-terminal processing protease CtpA/Prc
MNKYFFIGFILLFSTPLFSQAFKNDSIKLFIDKSIDLIKENSIHTENLDLIKHELYNKSKNVNSLNEIPPFYEEVFKLLNDHHGSLTYKGKNYGWIKNSSTTNFYLKQKIKTEKKVISKVLDKKIGYIRIPGNSDFAFKKVDSISNDIVSHLNSINSSKIKGWIIDLRLNTGGNMYPILLGLKEFIGTDLVFGGFKNSKNELTGEWQIKAGKMQIDGIELTRTSNLNYPIKENIPVVILISPYTASAGEMTTISMIGRKNTYLVGELTADYTTAVQGFKINEYAGLNLSTDYVIDRNQKIYKNNIQPDFKIINGDDLENLKNDKKIIKALELLKK